MKTVVYFDAFNFYFGAIKGTPFKWLDLSRMCSLMLPRNQIIAIKSGTTQPFTGSLFGPACWARHCFQTQ
ncbi:MAG: hypothetical protein KBA51_06105 [Kiritimatiellae bacterium]|nr:hypothetical protein [Kiritimatiellia bacterium]